MVVLIDGDSIPFVVCFNGVKEELTELEDYKRKADNYILAILQCVASSNYIMYLGGRDNFRFKVEAQKPYKGNRGKGEKPLYFDEIRKYLIEQYKAVVTDGVENDDLLVMSQIHYNNTKIESCIASMDKDLQQCPGYHVNIKTLTVTEVDQDKALYNLWIQVAKGDSTDNISGCEGCGQKCAENLLNGAKTENYAQLVLGAYIDKYGEELGLKWFEANYQLVRLITKNKNFKLPEIQNIDLIIAKIVN